MPSDRPAFPYDDFRAASAEPEHHASLEAFAAEYGSEAPDRERLERHAATVRGVPALVGPFERWWLDPKVQAFFADLNATGI